MPAARALTKRLRCFLGPRAMLPAGRGAVGLREEQGGGRLPQHARSLLPAAKVSPLFRLLERRWTAMRACRPPAASASTPSRQSCRWAAAARCPASQVQVKPSRGPPPPLEAMPKQTCSAHLVFCFNRRCRLTSSRPKDRAWRGGGLWASGPHAGQHSMCCVLGRPLHMHDPQTPCSYVHSHRSP